MIEAEREIREALVRLDAGEFGSGNGWNTACRPTNIDALLTELDRLRQWEVAGREWLDKTDWMQSKDAPTRWLGKHRADILRAEIDRLTREHNEARAENTKLHGWYEDAEQRVMAEQRLSFRTERDALAKALAELVACKALKDAGLRSPEDEDAYFRRKPAAWAAARAALAQIEKERSE